MGKINFLDFLNLRPFFKFLRICYGDTPLCGAEIGVSSGDNALTFYKVLNFSMLYLVDSWTAYNSDNIDIYTAKAGRHIQHIVDSYKKTTYDRFSDKINVTIIPKTSEYASNLVEDESLDFVYIDAGHTYNDVLNDCKLWTKKVKHSGYVGGHDWEHEYFGEELRLAVTTFVKEHDYKLCISGDDWWFEA